MRVADPHFLEKLRAFDDKLFVVWHEKNPNTGSEVCRWQVRRKCRDGSTVHVMWVVGPKAVLPQSSFVDRKLGTYRPLDERIIHHLRERDTWRYYGNSWSHWDSTGRKEMMNKLGFKDGQEDEFREAHERAADERYYDFTLEMAARIEYAKQQAPEQVTGVTKQEMIDAERAAEEKVHVDDAMDRGVGVVELDPRHGIARRVE